MKRQMKDMTGFTDAAGGWLSAIAGLPAVLINTERRPASSEWLGWDAWVNVSEDDRVGR